MNIVQFTLDNISVTYQGDHSSLGSVQFKQVSIVAMGPHYFPLGELTRFGIFREGADVSDIEVSNNKVAGWTKIVAGDRPFGSGATWIYFGVEKEKQKTKIVASFENGKGEDPFAFVFFVKADEIGVGEKKYLKGGLSNYQGVSGVLECRSQNEIIRLDSQVKTPIQIIPLAGGEFFWGADFLIAFEIHDINLRYQWTFTESV